MRASIAERFSLVNQRSLVAPLTFASLLLAAPAQAHPEFAPQTVNRYIKLDLVAPDGVRLAYTIMVGAAPAAPARAQADANHDGHVDAAEARALGERMGKAVAAGVNITVDGKRVTPAFEAPEVGLAGDAVGPSPFSVDLVARLPCPGPAPHTVAFDDAPADPLLGETEIRVEESPSTQLLTSHRGPSGNEKQTRFLFSGPKFSALEDRSIGFSFAASRAPEPVKQQGSANPLRLLAAALVGLVVGVVVALRRVRQRKMNG